MQLGEGGGNPALVFSVERRNVVRVQKLTGRRQRKEGHRQFWISGLSTPSAYA